ncbi:MAG TPA: hypothetical protein VIO38_05920, partial [Rariglobus sp.]
PTRPPPDLRLLAKLRLFLPSFRLKSWTMKPCPHPTTPVRPLLTEAQMQRILSSRRSITSAEAYRQIETHLGRRLSPGRRKTSVNGRTVWVSC